MKLSMLFSVVLVAVGCSNSNPPPTVTITASPSVPVAAPSTVMNSTDLDLGTIAGLIRDGKATDAPTLQALINDPNSGVNNVDTDHDGQVDPVTVSEVQTATGKQFNLVANPASGQQLVVANINITQNAAGATVNAGYPAYVAGYDTNYYSYQSAANLAFLMWALSPRPVYLSGPLTGYGWYHPYHVYSPSQITQTRTTYDTTTRISPVVKSSPPPSYTAQAQAQRVPSTFAKAAPTPTTNNLNDRAAAKDFSVRDQSAPVQRATGFGAAPATAGATFAPRPAATSSPAPVTARPTGGASFGGGSKGPSLSVSRSSSKPGH